jgi:hypothetical protein
MVKIRLVADSIGLLPMLILTKMGFVTDLSRAEQHRQVVETVRTEAGITAEITVLHDRAEIIRVLISWIGITMEFATPGKAPIKNDLL